MSLIEEALRRIGDPLLPKTDAPPRGPVAGPESHGVHPWPTLRPAGGVPTHAMPRALGLVAAAVFALTVVLVLGATFWLGRAIPGDTPSIATPRSGVPSRTPPAKTASGALLPRQPARGEFLLTGVVAGGGEAYAMINGEIISVGETIGDGTLIAIGDGTATLRLANGREETLRVPR